MKWLPFALVLLVAGLIVFHGRADIAEHGLYSTYTIAPIVMLGFLIVFVIFLTRGGQTPGGGFK